MKKKILLIEDEEIMVDLIQKKLTKEGYEISIARDGEEGLEVMREVMPDLVLLDIVMPKKGGFEVIEEMKAIVKKAKPTSPLNKEIQKIYSRIESNNLPFICLQEIEVFRGSVRLQKVRNWYE